MNYKRLCNSQQIEGKVHQQVLYCEEECIPVVCLGGGAVTGCTVSSSCGPLQSLFESIIFFINAYRGFQYEKFLFRYIILKIANNCPERWLRDVYQIVANTAMIGTLLV